MRLSDWRVYDWIAESVCVLACTILLAAACAPSPEPRAPSPAVTATARPTTTATSTKLAVPTMTHTPFPRTATTTPTATPVPSSTPTRDLPTATTTATSTREATVTATHTPSPTQSLDCPVPPTGGFLLIWGSDPDLQSTLGCPFDPHPRRVPTAWQVQTAYQPFERGEMIWSDHVAWYPQPVIYVLYADSTYQRFDDTFDPETDPVRGGQTPPPGLVEPAYGFGTVWRDQPGVRERLGWATADETPGEGYFQMFLGGNMVWITQTDQTYVFVSGDNAVRAYDVRFSDE
jgi:hypothetical protein